MRVTLSRNNSSKIIGDSGKDFSSCIAICIFSQKRKGGKGTLPFIVMVGIKGSVPKPFKSGPPLIIEERCGVFVKIPWPESGRLYEEEQPEKCPESD